MVESCMSKGLYGYLECNLLFLSFSSGTIYDVHMLGLTDHLVCTMSSNVCRLAFELQQNRLSGGRDNLDSLGIILKTKIRQQQRFNLIQNMIKNLKNLALRQKTFLVSLTEILS